MKFILATLGSRGDVQPLLPLAKEMLAKNHQVLFCAPPDFEELIKPYCTAYHPLGDSMKKITEDHPELFGRKKVSLKKINELNTIQTRQQFELLFELGKNSDGIISGGPTYGTASVAEGLGVPFFYLAYTTNYLPSRFHPPAMNVPKQDLPGFINRLIWWTAKVYFNRARKEPLNALRKQYGIPPVKDYLKYLLNLNMLVATDPEIAPVPSDYPYPFRQIGALTLPSQEKLEPSLENFIQAGPPPVYIGFGSMPLSDPSKSSRMFIDTARKLNIRLVLDKGWANLGNVDFPDFVHVIEGAPHDQLFPRMAAVLHHGGGGTLAVAARAGVPQIITPIAYDQFYWGKRVFASGIGPQPCPIYKLNSEYLEKALEEALFSHNIQENALRIKEVLSRKNVPADTLTIIENQKL